MNLNQVTLPVTDVARAIEFYSKLGLKLIVKNLPTYARFECPDGSATLSVHRVEHVVPSEIVIFFECGRLDETVAALQRRGIVFNSPPADQPWLWREARLEDPDGNKLCLFHAGANRLHPPWRARES